MKRQDIHQRLQENQKLLDHYGVISLSIFGSVAREEQTEASDIDILVTFGQPIGLFSFLELKYKLEDILGMPVDLVTEQALHPRLRDIILGESIHVLS